MSQVHEEEQPWPTPSIRAVAWSGYWPDSPPSRCWPSPAPAVGRRPRRAAPQRGAAERTCQRGCSVAPSAANLGETTLGSNESDAVPKAAVQAIVDYCQTQTGATVKVNVNDHNTFQNSISSYLQGTPDDIVKWFAGNRLRFFAAQGLAAPIDDVWADIESNMTPGLKAASAGSDGKMYFVPAYNYPWVVLYRKSLFTEKGYTVPKTIEEFKALGDKMKTDGIVPLALGDKDGWPAMGTFDILNMRQNGYDFHVGLMEGREKWSDPKVKAVFELWKGLLPYFQEGAPGRTWQDAAKAALDDKTAGMYFLGTFAVEQAGEQRRRRRVLPVPDARARSSTPRTRSTPRSTGSCEREAQEP